MSKLKVQFLNFAILAILLPLIYGCKGGGGDSASFSGGTGGGSAALQGGVVIPPGSGGVETPPGGIENPATITQPEPGTMLLLGTGLLALRYLRSKRK